MIRGRRVTLAVAVKRRVQRHGTNNSPRLEAHIRLDSQVGKLVPPHDNLPRAADPVAVAPVPRVLAVAQAEPVTDDIHPRQAGIPPVAPGLAVVVAVKEAHEARNIDQSLHKGLVLPAVVARRLLAIVAAPALALLRDGQLVVYAGLVVRPWLGAGLYRPRRVDGDVDKGERGNGPLVLFRQEVVGFAEPGHDAGVHPVGLRGALEVIASAAVEEPQDELGGAAVSGTGCRVHGEVVVCGSCVLGRHHVARSRPGPHLLPLENVGAVRGGAVIVVSVRGSPCEVPAHHGGDDLVNVVRAVVALGGVAVDQVAVQNDEVWTVKVENIANDANRVAVLGRTGAGLS